MKLLRRVSHCVPLVTLLAWLPTCVLAQSSRPLELQQDEAAAQREQERSDQLRDVASQLKAIREYQAQNEERETRREAADKQYFTPTTASQWVLAGFAAIAGIIGALTLRANTTAARAAKLAAEAAHAQTRLAATTNLELKDVLAAYTVADGRPEMVTVGYKLTNISANAARSVVLNKRYGITGDPLMDDTPIRMDVISAGKGFHTRVTVGPLTEHQQRHLLLSALVVRFYATAEWIDPLDRIQERRLYRAVRVGPEGAVESIYISPDENNAVEE